MVRRALCIAFLFVISATFARADVLVFAAASLKEPLDRIAAKFDNVTVSYGGSGTLARQISLGAPADIVLLANSVWMETLVEGAHVAPDTVLDFASNALVLVGAKDGEDIPLRSGALQNAIGEGRLAIGLTQAVPAGVYGKSALTSLDLWDETKDRLAEVDNVRSALALVIRGQAPLGIVYATDVRISDTVRAVAVFPPESHPPIRYTAALTPQAGPEAAAFLAYLVGEEGQAVLVDAGFLPPVEIPQ